MDYAELGRRVGPVLDRAEAAGDLAALDYEALERFAADHRQILADYAYARTHFPGSALEGRLRRQAFAGHRLLAVPAPRRGGAVRRFFLEEYPRLFRAHRVAVQAAVGVFAGSAALGWAFTSYRPEFAALWFGTEGVEMMRRGEIWTDTVVSAIPPAWLASKVFTNNISVGLVAWAGGALLGLGALWMLVSNGMMVGAVLALGQTFDLTDRVFAFIAAHGPLELFLICVCGGGGLALGAAQVRPHDGPFGEGVARAGRETAALALGSAPWFVALGLVEGNLSPVAGLPTLAKATLGVLLFAAYLAYVSAPAPAEARA